MDWLRRAAEDRPDSPAVIAGSEVISYGDLDAAADGVASIIVGSGVGGERVALFGDRTGDTVAAVWGIQRAGSSPVMLDPAWPPEERRLRTRVAGARGLWSPPDGGIARLIARSAFASPVEGFPSADAGVVVFTSGSEGEPKPIRLGGGNVAASVAGSRQRLDNTADDSWLCVLPLCHVGGLSILWRQAEAGAPVVLEERFDAVRAAARLGEVGFASLVPTMLRRAIDAGAEGAATVLVGGGPVSVYLLREARDRGMLPLQTYGMTEAASQVCTQAPERWDEELGTAGLPIDGVEVRVVRDGEPVIGGTGRIQVRGPMVAADLDEDGWFTAGDVGIVDEAGRLTVLGRADAVIVTGGENVHPGPVQAVLESHRGVVEARVFGEPNDEWGMRVVAEVSTAGEVDVESLRSWAAQRLRPAQVPKEFRRL